MIKEKTDHGFHGWDAWERKRVDRGICEIRERGRRTKFKVQSSKFKAARQVFEDEGDGVRDFNRRGLS